MIPSAFVVLDKLPLTPSGKVDRRSLPDPDPSQLRAAVTASFVAPRTATEEALARLWREVLGLATVGVEDNFFELGGHSLLATRLVTRIQEQFGMALPLRTLFETPTIAQLAARLPNRPRPEGAAPIQPVSRDGALPLSFAQQRLWFLARLEADISAYHIPGGFEIRGRLDVAALQQSLNAVVERHAILRTTFPATDGQPVQVLAPTAAVRLPVVDLQALPSQEREQAAQRLANAERKRSFDLATGPLLRTALLRLEPERSLLLVTLHHIVADGWSLGIFARELAALYAAFRQGQPNPLPELPIQYVDFAHWQRQWLQGDRLDTQLSYWRSQLQDLPPLLSLPSDRPRPPVQTLRGDARSRSLSPQLTQALQQFSHQQGVTLFMTLLAAFQVLLFRYSGQSDFAVGTPVANRRRREVEDLIGFFVNTLVLRARPDPNQRFRDFLAQVRETALGAYAHQDLPFEKLVEDLQPERNLSYTPLFQVLFVLQNAPAAPLSLPGLSLDPLATPRDTAKFDLTLEMAANDAGGLDAELEYNRDLFDGETIERMLAHLQTLLEGIVAHPDECLQRLPLLSEAEQQQLLVAWNRTDSNTEALFLPAIEAQAQRSPQKVAVRCGDDRLTYGELNCRANQLAHYLRDLGVGHEVRVGLCLARSPQLLVALLAVLKAGGCYVPLDPAYPRERLAFMLRDARASVLLTQTELQRDLPDSQATVVCLDTDFPTTLDSNNLDLTLQPQQLAYIIYTSGSTGQPKGVQISHRAIANFLAALGQHLQLTAEDVWLAVTSLSFDIAALELFLPLCVGGSIALATRETAADGRLLLEQLQASGATVMQGTPATWRLLLAAGWQGTPGLQVLCGGEALTPELARALQTRARGLWNLYGPTETTVWSAMHRVETVGDTVAIGRAIANTQLYVLDGIGQPVPIGVTGELYIGGAGVARGYLGRPQLTAAQFLPDPFRPEAGGRLYRTGDLARYRADGTLEFLGRRDTQVKVRGYRLELGEIETRLQEHPQVEAAVALAMEDAIVAYVVAGEAVEPEAFRTFLGARLPAYAIPQQFVRLDALPVTPNGKIDRRALPAPTTSPSEDFLAPRNRIEAEIARAWQSVLGREAIGVTANFFDLGGHSLLATQAIARIRQTLQVEIPLRQLFETPTVAGLAAWVARQEAAAPGAAIVPVSRERPLPLSFAQERLWFVDRLDPGNVAYNEAAALRLTGTLNIAALQQSVQAIADRHEILRTSFQLQAGQPVQEIADSVEVALARIDLQGISPEQRTAEVERLAIAVARQPFDLTRLPLFRLSLLQLSDREFVVLFVSHHIISDAWSKGVFVQELARFYTAYAQGTAAELPPLPMQYADFAVWQRQQQDAWKPQLDYWRQQLGGTLPQLPLPTDYPRPQPARFRGKTARFQLSPDLSQRLHAFAQSVGATPFMTLLAGFYLLLYRYSGQTDAIVGTDIANRNRAELEPLIGFFVNLLVLRTDLSGNPSFRELVARVRDVALAAYANQDIPFAQLVNALQPPRPDGTAPFFQVLFVLQNAPAPPLELPGLTLSPLELELGTAKFDLAVFLHATPAGLAMAWNYNTDLFAASTIARMANQFETLLAQLANHPDTDIETLTMTDPRSLTPSDRATPKRRKKFQRLAPKAVRQSATDLVKAETLPCGLLALQPNAQDVDLATWAAGQRSQLQAQLLQRGAILFRGFAIPTAQEFERVAQSICPELFGDYGDLPRAEVGGKVYGATPYPEDRAIGFHNESSHLAQWPQKIWFYCQQPAQQGGATPIADGRRVYQLLPPLIRERLQRKQLTYVRNYVRGLDVSWQDFFHTRDRAVVEQSAQAMGMAVRWLDDDSLQTRQVRPAIARHPQTGEWLAFNQIQLHHPAYLDADTRASLQSLLGGDRFPRQVYYGDGCEIEPEVLAALDAAYREAEQVFTWQAGDILMLDNMLMAHGRHAYVGPRRIVVAMGEMVRRTELDAPPSRQS